ncbi:MAG: hypothetical protein PUB46_04050 [Lachnospiraceae bacterium]|uniref:hypothetical protein n=1 Tax=Roseburia hominis TaxID=301301 RepID=UPI001F4368CA|nr:hypothetical protein [Roseburia hominis]MDD6169237.1 hypothetical protein [Lachnospiraceae bacterium]MDY4839404.1 hypothetical protein [Lachnospiraceae bacterium]
MSVFENTVMVNRRPSYGQLFLKYLCFVVTVFFAMGIIVISPMLFFLPTIIMAFLTYQANASCSLEYEYTYIDGELDIAKIKAKRKRKELAQVDLDNLILIAPKGSGELNAYHNDKDTKILDATSKRPDHKVYEVVYRKNSSQFIIYFEPDENLLNLIRTKYMSKVIL